MMKRLDFLKTLGFRGPALIALLTSCIHEEDTFVEALKIQNQTSQTPVADTASVTGPIGLSVKLKSPTAIPTAALNAITGVRLRLDLTLSTNASLINVGGYLVKSGIVVAQSSSGVLVAATQTCSHEPKNKVIFNKTEFYCTQHGARFSLNGAGLNTFGRAGLTVYNTATDGNMVVIY